MTPLHVLALVGSLREASVSRRLAEAAVQTAPRGIEVAIFEGLDLVPDFDDELDTEPEAPDPVTRLRESITAADALLLVTSEYDASLPGVLRNSIDWASRPYGSGAVVAKKVALIGAGSGASAGERALDELVQILGLAGGKVVERACAAVGDGEQRFIDADPADDAETVAQLGTVLRMLGEAVRPGHGPRAEV